MKKLKLQTNKDFWKQEDTIKLYSENKTQNKQKLELQMKRFQTQKNEYRPGVVYSNIASCLLTGLNPWRSETLSVRPSYSETVGSKKTHKIPNAADFY